MESTKFQVVLANLLLCNRKSH